LLFLRLGSLRGEGTVEPQKGILVRRVEGSGRESTAQEEGKEKGEEKTEITGGWERVARLGGGRRGFLWDGGRCGREGRT